MVSHSARRPYGMEWNGMEWNGMEWNGMECNGMEWNGMEWNLGNLIKIYSSVGVRDVIFIICFRRSFPPQIMKMTGIKYLLLL
jgi:hypothetical protein